MTFPDASDAGGNLKADARTWRYRLWWPLVRRTLDLAVEGGRAQRRRALIDRATLTRALHEATSRQPSGSATEHVALWRTSLDLIGQPLLPADLAVAAGWREHISALPTRMWPMRRWRRRASGPLRASATVARLALAGMAGPR